MSSNSAPAAPNYQPIADAQMASSAESSKIAQEQLDWAKQTYADNKNLTDQVVNTDVATQQQNNANAQADRARYQSVFQPEEDSLVKDANSYASPERRDLEMGKAGSDVAQNFQAARTNAAKDLEAFGVNPGATRFAALDVGARTQEAASKAAAMNTAGQQVDATGRALRENAINIGRGYPAQVAGETNSSLQAGAGAVNSTLATTASGSNTMGSPVNWTGQSNNSLNGAVSALNTGYQNNLSTFNANQNASSGIGSALGLGASLLLAASGGEVPDAGATPGGAVPVAASPSAGRALDDVPSNLTAGEFVMPKQAVDWHGQKAMYAMIDKATKGRAEAKARTGAVPQVRPAAIQRPNFQSRPGAALQIQRAA